MAGDLVSQIDVKAKTIHLTGEVNEDMYLVVQRGISRLIDLPGNFCFTINTYGGNITDGLAIHDLIKACCPEAQMIVFGACMSAGMVILQAGGQRSASENSELMIHYGEEGADSGQDKKFNERLRIKEHNILSHRLKASKATLKKWQNTVKYFDVNEALKYGLIDRIAE